MRYVYGIVRGNDQKVFDIAPISGGDKVATGPAKAGLAFISSEIGDKRLRPSRANIKSHTRVLEEVMKHCDVLPVRFGTLIDSDTVGEQVLEANTDEFARAFGRIENRCEISIRASWASESIFDEVMETFPALKRERDMLNVQAQSHSAKIDFGKKVEAAIAQIRSQDANAMLEALREHADDVIETAVVGETDVANLAFLVEKEKIGWFDAALEKLDLVHRGRWRFTYIGPMPAFSFSDMKIDFNPAQMAE
ncbi:MAG: GvpL/GvpF family gas vesicle protein [Pseudomonadota bacterium]